MSKKGVNVAVGAALLGMVGLAVAATSATVNSVDEKGVGKALGTVTFEDGKSGLIVTTDLQGLTPGQHGFHLHENGDCSPKEKDGKMVAGLAAGGHYDPDKSGRHEGPKGKGHRGDLPPLVVDKNGNAKEHFVVSRLKLADVQGRSVVVHEGGDNFADQPKPLGGGGNRVACGVIK